MRPRHGRAALLTNGAIRKELEALRDEGCDVVWYDDITELLETDVLSGVAVFVLKAGPLPRGVPLALLARLNLEFPRIQKVAVVEGPLPLPIARFLASCGVELVWANADGSVEHVASLVDRMLGRSGWIAPWSHAPTPHVGTGGPK